RNLISATKSSLARELRRVRKYSAVACTRVAPEMTPTSGSSAHRCPPRRTLSTRKREEAGNTRLARRATHIRIRLSQSNCRCGAVNAAIVRHVHERLIALPLTAAHIERLLPTLPSTAAILAFLEGSATLHGCEKRGADRHSDIPPNGRPSCVWVQTGSVALQSGASVRATGAAVAGRAIGFSP